jgi:branched-chain amino acid transport system ATP-binding protein
MPLLELESVDAFHGDLQVVYGVSMSVEPGEVLALIGANGAGKSTLLRTITGLIPAAAGRVRFDGTSIGGLTAERIAALGIAMVPEGRCLFASLSVEENLLMGTLARRTGRWTLQTVYALFPMLIGLRHRDAMRLSGGEQQMVAIGRALMSNPRLLLFDELSLGLSPRVIEEIYRAIGLIRSKGMSVVLVEQDVARACTVSDRMLCLLKGHVTLAGRSSAASLQQVASAYFGG